VPVRAQQEEESAITQRRELYYSGHVQGVGFRYTAHRLAQNYDLTGFVRNLPDRRVHLVVEGRREEIDWFLSDLQREMGGNIRDVQSDTLAANGEYSGFEITY
jgi:acylphosphatase